jgi:hypothetical protein
VYAQFLQYRYAFNADTQQVFAQLRRYLDEKIQLPSVPAALRKVYEWSRNRLVQLGEQSAFSKVAAAMREQQQQQHPQQRPRRD